MKLDPAQQLHVINRWLEVEGELRVALLRVCLIIGFYSVQLVNFMVWNGGSPAEATFHRQATYLCATWLFASLAVVVMISRQTWPPIGKYVSSIADVGLLSIMAAAASGPASPLMTAYLILVVLAGLRGSLPLIWFTTIACVLAYICLVVWCAQFSVPVRAIEIMVMLLAIAATGVITGQMVRMIKQIVLEISTRHAGQSESVAAGESEVSS